MFNRHKFARKLGRLKRRNNLSPFAPRRLDFSWSGGSGNPLFRKDKGLPRSLKTRLAVAFGTVAASASILLFHPFFSIEREEIAVDGLHRISRDEITDAVMGILDTRHALVFPGTAYVLLQEEEIADILIERYPLASVSVKKLFPNRLRIVAEETRSTILYDTGERLALVGPDGRVIELLRPIIEDTWTVAASSSARSTYAPPTEKLRSAFGDYPIVYDARDKEIAVNGAALHAEIAQGMLEWFAGAKKQDLALAYAKIADDLGEATLKTEEGWEIRVNVREGIPDQMEKLRLLLLKMSAAERAALVYIDLRFRDRIFWQ